MRRKFINKIIAGTIISTTLCTLVPVRASAEWTSDYQNNWYYTQDNEKMTGWKKIQDKLYYFDANGKMQRGWIKAESSWYFLQNNGVLKIGWFKYDRNWYYSDLNGEIQKGTMNIAKKVYIFDENGIMKTNNTVINGQFYTIGSDGVVAGNKTPTPDKEFDEAGNCLVVLKNSDSKASISPTYSSFSDVIEDNSVSDDDPNEGRTFKVRFKDSNGAELNTKSIKNGKTVDLYAPTKDGYIFASWNTKSDGSGKSYDDNDNIKVKEDINLYAQWSDNTVIYVNGIIIKGSSYVTVNKTTQMTAEVSPSDAKSTSVTWSVSDGTGKATIDSNGILTGTVAGTVTVKATANDESKVSTTKAVTVSISEITVPVSKILIGSKTGVFRITASSGTLQMTASVYPDNANNQEVEWSVQNIGGSAEIDPNTGLLKAISNGVVIVTATAKDGSGINNSTTVEITGQNVEISLKTIIISGRGGNVINTDAANGGTNGKLQMEATIDPITASNKAIRWLIIEGNEFANISTTGLITAKATGKVKVQAENIATGLVSNIAEITITNQSVKVTGITINDPGTISGEVTLNAVTSPAAATITAVKWSVQNGTGSAEIGIDTGVLTPLSDGSIVVKAIATDGSNVSDTQVVKISGLSTIVPVTSIDKVFGKDNAISITRDDGTLQMYATILPSYATTTTPNAVRWSIISSGTGGSANIDPNTGLLTAVSNGKVTVRATSNDNTKIYKDGYIYLSGQITQVMDITISSPKDEVAVGATVQMSADVLPTEATNQDVTWHVESGTGTAKIDPKSGLLTGNSVGIVTVVATSDKGTGMTKSKEIKIISPVKVDTIEVNAETGSNDKITVPNGNLQMSAVVKPTEATNKVVTWSVEQAGDAGTKMTGKAKIDSVTGVLTAVANGTVNVKATSTDSNKIASNPLTITISNQTVKATGFLVTPFDGTTTNTIVIDDATLQMKAAVIPTDATTTPASVTWKVEPYAAGPLKVAGSAEITPTGLLTAVSNGDVKVKATGTATDGTVISGEYIVTLSGQILKAEGIAINNSPSASIAIGTKLTLKATITPTNATSQIVIWSIVEQTGAGVGTAQIGQDGSFMGLTSGGVRVSASVKDETGVVVATTTTTIFIK